MMKAYYKKEISYSKLLMTLICVVIIYLFWNSMMMYPFKLFTVFMHELGHGLAALATGGSFIEMTVSPKIGGYAVTNGGNQIIINNAGYIGSLLVGGLLMWLSKSKRFNKLILIVLDAVFLLISILVVRNLFGWIASGMFILILTVLIWKGPEFIRMYFVRILGMTSCFYVLYRIVFDVFVELTEKSDVAGLAELTGVSVYAWGIMWVVFGLLMIILLMKNMVTEKKKIMDYDY